MQSVTGRAQVTQRRKRIATMFGIGAGGGAAAGLTGFALKRGLFHYRRLRGKAPQAFQTPKGAKGRRPRKMTMPKMKVTAPVAATAGTWSARRMFHGIRSDLYRGARAVGRAGRTVGRFF